MTGLMDLPSAVPPHRQPTVLVDRCICLGRPFADLLPEARARGWALDQLIQATGCGGQCGLCRPYLRRMLATGETTFDQLLPPEAE